MTKDEQHNEWKRLSNLAGSESDYEKSQEYLKQAKKVLNTPTTD
jgi:hypothetical protein